MDKELEIKDAILELNDNIKIFQKEIDKFQRAIDIQNKMKKEYEKKLKKIQK